MLFFKAHKTSTCYAQFHWEYYLSTRFHPEGWTELNLSAEVQGVQKQEPLHEYNKL